ncbi:hypothetical protein H6P81_005382 [Aristolochia fimbriata]|uniref:RING-type E3 ubiquitin transferase n=1 Tax=Aristolochia fimbriata TaxID=158543 RepID=A0AAV7EYS8_ARIFI|nr:hypothetical protein H6P81_005382 [Aristolochia fimbriata]
MASWTDQILQGMRTVYSSRLSEECTSQVIVTFVVEDLQFRDVVTDFGTIREEMSRRPGAAVRRATVAFGLDDDGPTAPLESYLERDVPAGIDEAFSNMGVSASSEEFREWAAGFVLGEARQYLEHRRRSGRDYGLGLLFHVKEHTVVKIRVGRDGCRRWLGWYVESGVWDGTAAGGVAAAAEEEERCCCAICLNEFVAGEEIGRTGCGHSFHPGCIISWFCKSLTCPMCRSRIRSRPNPNS